LGKPRQIRKPKKKKPPYHVETNEKPTYLKIWWNRLGKIWKALGAIALIAGLIASGITIYNSIYPPAPQKITVNIYNPPLDQPPPKPNIPQSLPSKLPLDVGFHTSPLFKGKEGKLHFNLTTILKNAYTSPITIGWLYLRIVNVTYIDESFERWSVSNNSTFNQNIEPNKSLYVRYGISEYGFEKEPKVLNFEIQIRISDPEGVRGKISGSVKLEKV